MKWRWSLPVCVLSDLKAETGSCGRTRVAGSTTSSGRRSRRRRAVRSSLPSTDMTSETAAALESDHTGSVGPGESNDVQQEKNEEWLINSSHYSTLVFVFLTWMNHQKVLKMFITALLYDIISDSKKVSWLCWMKVDTSVCVPTSENTNLSLLFVTYI